MKKKTKTIKIDITKVIRNSKKLRKSSIEKFKRIQTQNMIYQGEKIENIKEFNKLTNKVIRSLTNKKWSKTNQNNLKKLFQYGDIELYKDKSFTFNYSKRHYTKYTKFIINEFDKKDIKYLKNQIPNLSKRTQSIFKNPSIKKQNFKIDNQDFLSVVESMGGIAQAIENYPVRVSELINDYLGMDLETFKANYKKIKLVGSFKNKTRHN